MGEYIFRKSQREDIPILFRLVEERIRWMDEVGIEQWNVTAYTDVYPLSYYLEKERRGEVFVLEDSATKEILSGAVLKSQDERWEHSAWNDGMPAFYVHNFVSKIGFGGTGRVFLELAERYALETGKEYMRLDSAVDNEPLSRFYEALGYEVVGDCVDGVYEGLLRQKKLG